MSCNIRSDDDIDDVDDDDDDDDDDDEEEDDDDSDDNEDNEDDYDDDDDKGKVNGSRNLLNDKQEAITKDNEQTDVRAIHSITLLQ